MKLFNLSNISHFMNALLKGDSFDDFLVQEIVIKNGPSFVIEGEYTKEEGLKTDYSKVKNLCFDMVKGKTMPKSMKFVLALSPEKISELITTGGVDVDIDSVSSLSINVLFNGEALSVTTGTSFKTFVMDKTLEKAFDAYIEDMMSEYGAS